MNYFEFFGLEPQLEVDLELLRKQYIQKSREAHPDHFTLESAEVQMEVLDYSSMVNKAYQTLKSEDDRWVYFLEVVGMPVGDDVSLPSDFLMEMMDINESLEELDPSNTAQAQQAIQEIHSIELDIYGEISSVLQTLKELGYKELTEEQKKLLKTYYLKRKYILRIKENSPIFAAPK